MAVHGRPLHPSYRSRLRRSEQRTNSSASKNGRSGARRRWGAAPIERTMLGYVISLSIMVALANLPIGSDFLDGGSNSLYSTADTMPHEPLALVTVQDLPTESDESGEERQPSDAETDEHGPPIILDEARSSAKRADRRHDAAVERASALRPVAAAASIPSSDETRQLLRQMSGPPEVDEPPKVQVGSMIVSYPLSALKRAIEGLVIVRFTVEPSGRASGVKIVKGLDPACDAEVVHAVENARFLPGRKKGREVPASSEMTVRFVLSQSGSAGTF